VEWAGFVFASRRLQPLQEQFEFYGTTMYAMGGQGCLDLLDGTDNPGTPVISTTCDSAAWSQAWTGPLVGYGAQGLIVNDGEPGAVWSNELCLDATNEESGTQLVVNECSSAASQSWQLK
jgi:Ricin-type beta-trefoil lectin domain